jgi:hypothetical protein
VGERLKFIDFFLDLVENLTTPFLIGEEFGRDYANTKSSISSRNRGSN